MTRKSAVIFGDSIMKCTVHDEGGYRSCYNETVLPEISPFIDADNRSRFGCTSTKGLELIRRAVSSGEKFDYALIEYGGNDSNFDWPAVCKSPYTEHYPATMPDRFRENILTAIDLVSKAGMTPVLMSLPPIHPERFFAQILSKGVDSEALLAFLGAPSALGNYQELYSDMVTAIAHEKGLPFVDVRSAFLRVLGHYFSELISDDGLHPSEAGYALLAETFRKTLEGAR